MVVVRVLVLMSDIRVLTRSYDQVVWCRFHTHVEPTTRTTYDTSSRQCECANIKHHTKDRLVIETSDCDDFHLVEEEGTRE